MDIRGRKNVENYPDKIEVFQKIEKIETTFSNAENA